MNFFKCFLILFLPLSAQFVTGQEIVIRKKINKIDSLIFYSNLPKAEKELNLLQSSLSKNNDEDKYSAERLEIMLLRTYINLLKEDFGISTKTTLKIVDIAAKNNNHEIEFKAYLILALVHEQAANYDLSKNYLDKAYYLYQTYHLENYFSTYCIRVSSYYRLTKNKDLALQYAYKGLEYAKKSQKYQSRRDLTDAYLLLGILLSKDDFNQSVKYTSLAAKSYKERNENDGAAYMYNNIAIHYFKRKELKNAHAYNDSAFAYRKKNGVTNGCKASIYEFRSLIFEGLGNKDSALFYIKKSHVASIKALKDLEVIAVERVNEQYQNDKKEAVIKTKNLQIILIINLLGVIIFASILLIRYNRKINKQNKIIINQVTELTKTLAQKQVLLSELQHRVKNNLQHVISILEIQKESINFNNIDELIRGNQNRIHSMALLHKKLNVEADVNVIDVNKYMVELSELVKESYENHSKKVSLIINTEIEEISVEKALPIGLILVELVSNSMKHAFGNTGIGIIAISLTNVENSPLKKLNYSDNGSGYDFKKENEKGLGMEIIKGLIDQLDATVESNQRNGFELTLYFK